MKTPYRKTWKGLTAQLFSKIRERCKRKGWAIPTYNLTEFRSWFEEHGGLVYNQWVMSSWKSELTPSVDRISPQETYYFKNMQVITARGNREKGDKEKIILWGVPVAMFKNGKLTAIFPSLLEASKYTGVNKNNISSCLSGKRKSAGGYVWKKHLEVLGNIYENKDLIK